eukprot:TRINITY_DN46031_c0_g1_i1.p1 TRINITY_DN46031_c0_g1~~TRINITY_DN46031_c0_g1_i1.p1  ORF type:complete len:1382 (-),score=237.15 TRINITY_DN46031_c0_g1_i1:137-4282(-)
MPPGVVGRVIAHLDLDCFYAQVEHRRLKIGTPPYSSTDAPPLGVQQWDNLIAVNYAARAHGVKRGLSADAAREVCPRIQLVHVETIGGTGASSSSTLSLPPDRRTQKACLRRYREASEEVFAVFARHAARCERTSIDEAYLDLTAEASQWLATAIPGEDDKAARLGQLLTSMAAEATCAPDTVASRDEDAALLAAAVLVQRLRDEVLAETGFTVSAGIADNKLLAKLGSACHKPNRQTIVPKGYVREFMAKASLKDLRGLGGKLGEKLRAATGLDTQSPCSELMKIPLGDLQQHLGEKPGAFVWRLCQGIDAEEVKANKMVPKQYLSFKSFLPHIQNLDELEPWLHSLAGELVFRLQSHPSRRPRTMVLHHRGRTTDDHVQSWVLGRTDLLTKAVSRSSAFPAWPATVPSIVGVARKILQDRIPEAFPCSRVAIGATDFVEAHVGPQIAALLGARKASDPPATVVADTVGSPSRVSKAGGELAALLQASRQKHELQERDSLGSLDPHCRIDIDSEDEVQADSADEQSCLSQSQPQGAAGDEAPHPSPEVVVDDAFLESNGKLAAARLELLQQASCTGESAVPASCMASGTITEADGNAAGSAPPGHSAVPVGEVLSAALPASVPQKNSRGGTISKEMLWAEAEAQAVAPSAPFRKPEAPDGEGQVASFHKWSRLHFLGTWRERFEQWVKAGQQSGQVDHLINPDVRARLESDLPEAGVPGIPQSSWALVDMDCFFVSVATKSMTCPNGPSASTPTAVVSSFAATGEICSANYAARAKGVNTHLWTVARAKEVYPSLHMVPISEALLREVEATWQQVYQLLVIACHGEPDRVHMRSCDEAFIDIRDMGDAQAWAQALRAAVRAQTNCSCSVGLGPSQVVAKLAASSCKPDGSKQVMRAHVADFLALLPLTSLPQVGRQLAGKLEEHGLQKCSDVLPHSKGQLQHWLGTARGEMIWALARGEDVGDAAKPRERKTVSAEINFGVRPQCRADVLKLLGQVAKQMSERLSAMTLMANHITLKVKIALPGWVEPPWKKGGHGRCEDFSRSANLPQGSSDSAALLRHATRLLDVLDPDHLRIRGIGLAAKVEPCKAESAGLQHWFKASGDRTKGVSLSGGTASPAEPLLRTSIASATGAVVEAAGKASQPLLSAQAAQQAAPAAAPCVTGAIAAQPSRETSQGPLGGAPSSVGQTGSRRVDDLATVSEAADSSTKPACGGKRKRGEDTPVIIDSDTEDTLPPKAAAKVKCEVAAEVGMIVELDAERRGAKTGSGDSVSQSRTMKLPQIRCPVCGILQPDEASAQAHVNGHFDAPAEVPVQAPATSNTVSSQASKPPAARKPAEKRRSGPSAVVASKIGSSQKQARLSFAAAPTATCKEEPASKRSRS